MARHGNHCSFVLLAEFDILEGAQLKYQFPQPLGIDESVLAMSMLPDGAEAHLDDWTIFFLNQTPFNTISPVLALDSPSVKSVALPNDDEPHKPDLLCVLNLVRTKHDKSLNRGAKVLALAICTRHPFIQIFKPFLLMALDDYFSDPSQDCLARLFDAVNSMDLSGAPLLTRNEKLVMRSSERKDIFSERFSQSPSTAWTQGGPHPVKPSLQHHRSNNSNGSYSSFEEGILLRNRERDDSRLRRKDQSQTDIPSSIPFQQSPSDSSFSLGGSAVWVGDETVLELGVKDRDDNTATATSLSRGRKSLDASSSSSHAAGRDTTYRSIPFPQAPNDNHHRPGLVKDTHFYHATVPYKDHHLPIKMPLATFPEEVGDYSLITLIRVFSSQHLLSGPIHPHLHTNGPQTHPIIVLFNALITGKRIIFLGHRRPAGDVSNFVLAACALASGCGSVLRGFIERAFPYANLRNRDDWESVPAYIAGVTNPIFETSKAWDLLLDISTGTVTVAKDIHITYPPTAPLTLAGGSITRTGTLKADSSLGSEDDIARLGKEGARNDQGKDNNADKVFIEDIRAAIDDHFGESLVRTRFTEYAIRFVRLASRYEEEITSGTTFGYPSVPFTEIPGRPPKLGSGIAFSDESVCYRELAANAHRIEAWRNTNSYKYLVMDYAKQQSSMAIKGFDVTHQLFKLRYSKNLLDVEVLTIMRSLAEGVKTYDQVVELLASLPHGSGLLHIGFCLFHQKEAIRDCAVNLFNQLRMYPVGVLYLQGLNHFQRYAYVRQAHAKERRVLTEQTEYRQHNETGHVSTGSRSYSHSGLGSVANGSTL